MTRKIDAVNKRHPAAAAVSSACAGIPAYRQRSRPPTARGDIDASIGALGKHALEFRRLLADHPARQRQNFKFVSWADVEAALDLR